MAHDGIEVGATAEDSQRNHAEHRTDGMLAVAAAGIGHGTQRFGQRLELGGGYGQRRAFAFSFAGRMHPIKLRGAEPLARVGAQRLDPQLFGPIIGHVEFRPLPAVAFGEPERNPASGFVNIRFSGLNGIRTELIVMDNLGRTVFQQKLEDGQQSLELDLTAGQWRTGLYTVMIKSGGERAFQRLMIQQ